MRKTFIVSIAAFGFAVYASAYSLASNISIATFILWGIAIAFAVYGARHRAIDAFCRKGIGRVIKRVFIVAAIALAAMMVFLIFHGATSTMRGDEEVIVVLGAGLRGDQIRGTLLLRMESALEAHRKNANALIVVTGGQGADELLPESHAMRDWLTARGVPAATIAVEDESASTKENFLFAQKLLEERGIAADTPMLIVTSSYHCYRARRIARSVGFSNARVFPARTSVAAWLPCHIRETLAVAKMAVGF